MSLPKSKHRVSAFYHPSIHQFSTLEKTKLYHYPNLTSVLNTSFQQIACACALARDLCHGRQRVSPFFHIFSFRTPGTDFHNFSSPGFLTPKMTELREPLHSDSPFCLDFAVTLSSPDSFFVLFDITSEQSAELKWLMLNKHKR